MKEARLQQNNNNLIYITINNKISKQQSYMMYIDTEHN
jgi:hypothetical protein